jgi:hypothetical protein
MTADPLNWLPDGEAVSLDEFRARLSGSIGYAANNVDVQGSLAGLRASGRVSVVGDPRQPETIKITKLRPAVRREPVPASRPEFHSLGGNMPDLRLDQVESRLAALERRVSELEAERA